MLVRYINRTILMLSLALYASANFAASVQNCNAGELCNGFIERENWQRSFEIYLPKTYTTHQSLPLILALHGGGGDGLSFAKELLEGKFDNLADKAGFIIVYPNGIDKAWNNGRNGSDQLFTSNANDVGFIRALIDYLILTYQIDPNRVYVTGMSSGGLMAHRLACESADKIAAIAPVVASMSIEVSANCAPSRSISVLMINGTNDPLMQWNSNKIKGVLGGSRGERLSVPETLQKWLHINKMKVPAEIKTLPNPTNDGIGLSQATYTNSDGTAVILVTENGAGHTWPQGNQYLPEQVIGKVSQGLDANEMIWAFFKKHPKSH